MTMLKKGDRVRMTEALKKKMRGDCKSGAHVGLANPDPEEPETQREIKDKFATL